ncbi:hypothetical protein D3C86_1268650 [compost metagenome]
MPNSTRETVLCRYHYDPLDRQNGCTALQQPVIQRFHCKSRLATEIQGSARWSILQHDDQLLAQQNRLDAKVSTTLLATDQQRSVLNALEATQPNPLAYTPYGHRPAKNSLLSLLGFNGERPDPVTGHYHLGNGYRQFNPVLMRFNSPDSWSPFGEGGLNAYGYCDGEPISQSDPTGHISLKWLNPLRWLRSSKPKAGIPVRSKSDMMEDIINQYKKPGPERSFEETVTIDNGVTQNSRTRYFTTHDEFAKLKKNKLKLYKSIEYNGYTLKTEHPISIHKSRDTHSVGPGKIHKVDYNGRFNIHMSTVADYSNLNMQTYRKKMTINQFDKIANKSTGMLAGELQKIRKIN